MEISKNVYLGRDYSESEIRGALEQITRPAERESNSRALSNYSRVNEQELFGALILLQLKDLGKGLASKFLGSYRVIYADTVKADPKFGVYDSVWKSLSSIRKAGLLAKEKVTEIRRYALGKSQLDSIKDEVSIKRVTPGKTDTAVRALKTALAKIKENPIATDLELDSFRDKNIARRQED